MAVRVTVAVGAPPPGGGGAPQLRLTAHLAPSKGDGAAMDVTVEAFGQVVGPRGPIAVKSFQLVLKWK